MSEESTAEEAISAALHDPTPAKETMIRGAEAMAKAIEEFHGRECDCGSLRAGLPGHLLSCKWWDKQQS